MRIIAGRARGRVLRAPPGGATRPTSDLVRGALFSMLEARSVDLSRTLDLYAGSGAMGIEALSRGASWCDFVERHARAAATIRENLRATDFSTRAAVHTMDVARAGERLTGPYTLVIADPPYDDASADAVLDQLARSPLMDASTTIAWERSSRKPVPGQVGAFTAIARRRHGDTIIVLFQQEPAEEEAQ